MTAFSLSSARVSTTEGSSPTMRRATLSQCGASAASPASPAAPAAPRCAAWVEGEGEGEGEGWGEGEG